MIYVAPDVGPPWLSRFMVIVRMAFTMDNVEAAAITTVEAEASSCPEAGVSEMQFMA